MNKTKRKRLSVDIDDITHRHIKKIVIDRNLSIKDWIMEAIIDKIKKDTDLGWQ
jgi:hypothetical protein